MREAREEKGKKGKKDKSFAAAKLLFSRGVSDGKKNPCKRLAGGGGNTNQAVPNNIRLTSAPKISGSSLIMYGLRPVSLLILIPFLNWDTSIIFE